MLAAFFLPLLLLAGSSALASARSFSPSSFGAVGDGLADDTTAFQSTLNAACTYSTATTKPSTVLVPHSVTLSIGFIQLQGPCGPGLTLQVDGSIIGPGVPADVASLPRAVLWFQGVVGLVLAGQGSIDGQGDAWWKLADSLATGRPTLVLLDDCNNSLVANLTFQNAPQIHVWLNGCTSTDIFNITTNSSSDSPNTDSIHISHSSNISVSYTTLHGGDDDVSIVTGSSNITITQTWATAGHGISIGSLGKGGSVGCVSNVLVDQVVLVGTTNGVRIKTWDGGLGCVQNVVFKNIWMKDVTNPIVLDQDYCPHGNCPDSGSGSGAVSVQDVTFLNIQGTTNSTQGVYLNCSTLIPCFGIQMSNINITSSDPLVPLKPVIKSVYGTFNASNSPGGSFLGATLPSRYQAALDSTVSNC